MIPRPAVDGPRVLSPRILSYCTNVHPGETVVEIQRDLDAHAVPLKDRLGVDILPLGLRLGERAVRELSQGGGELEAFCGFLADRSFRAYTLNVFPQRGFHDAIVKQGVYSPDWSSPSRFDYTVDAARVLARLLPASDPFGTLSTLPLGYDPAKPASPLLAASVPGLLHLAVELARLEEETGAHMIVCLEPEPLCLLETMAELRGFFRDHLLIAARALESFAGRSGEETVLRHLGACYDACHGAVAFEDPATEIDALEAAGIVVGKVQVSSALELPANDAPSLAALERFDEPRFLHQVVAKDASGKLHRFLDLAPFLAWARTPGESFSTARCHFHVPIHRSEAGELRTTRDHLETLLQTLGRRPWIRHLEVETYTFDVLPGKVRQETPLVASLEQELRFAASRLEVDGDPTRRP